MDKIKLELLRDLLMELGEEVEKETGRANHDFQALKKAWIIALKRLDK
jgi:hypothetical protein